MHRHLVTLRKSVGWPALTGPLILFLLVTGFYWKLVFTSQYTWFSSLDLTSAEIPRFQFEATQWQRGALPLWDPHQWCGQPFLGQVIGAASPTHWPLSFVPFGADGKIPMAALNWFFVLLHFVAALFCYRLCRDLALSRGAAVAGGLVFALSGFLGTHCWPSMMSGLLWAPLVFLFLLRAFRGHRPAASAALSGLFLGLSWLSGHHEVPIYLSTAVAFLWAYRLWTSADARLRVVALACLTFAIAGLTGAFQIVPGYEYGHLAKRWVGAENAVGWRDTVPYFVHQKLSFAPDGVLGVVVPWAGDLNAFLGVTAFSLAAIGVARRWRKPEVPLFSVLAVAALLLSMAAFNIFHGLLYAALPWFDKARSPNRILAVFCFAAAPLVAYGIDAVTSEPDSKLLSRIAGSLAALGAAALVLGKVTPNEHIVLAALGALLTAALLAGWQRGAFSRMALLAGLVLLMLFELGPVSALFPNLLDRKDPAFALRLTANADIGAFLRAKGPLVRVEYDEPETSLNFGDWEGIDVLQGYGASVTENILRMEVHRRKDLLGVRYVVTRKPMGDATPVFAGSSGMRVYPNTSAFPRAWAVHSLMPYQNDRELAALLDGPNLRTAAPIRGAMPALESCASPDEVAITGYTPDEVRIQANLGCRGMVVLSDTWYPGWQAKVDGAKVPIHEVYGALRGVVAGAGRHEIVLRFQPKSVRIGAALSLLGILAACIVAWRSRS